MATVLLPYVQLYKAKGRTYAYYRRGDMRERLPGEIGSPEFLSAYQAAIDKFEHRQRPQGARENWPAGSLGALIAEWRLSPEYKELKEKTRKGYDWGLSTLNDDTKVAPVAKLNRAWIIRTRDKLAESPGKANYFVTVLKKLLFFGLDREYLKVNPAVKIKKLKGGSSYRAWTDEEIAAFTTESAGAFALPVLLGLYTGQRRGDVLRLTWSAYERGVISLTQSKTGKQVFIPIHPVLKRAIDAAAARKTAVTICTRPDGRPWSETYFSHEFAAKRTELGLPDDLQYHGLRHSAASRLAEAGASDAQIQAVTGHQTRQMVEHYTAAARQKKLAQGAIAKLPKGNEKKP